MAFAGKTLQGKRGIRGGVEDPLEQMESFVQFYPQFIENFEQLEEDTREEFQNKGDDVLADKNMGSTLCKGDQDEVKEELDSLEKQDLKAVMTFLIEEQVIEFDDWTWFERAHELDLVEKA